MRTVPAALVLAILLNPASAVADFTCPRTLGNEVLGSPLPKSENWYGSEALAVQLPAKGVWPTTAPGANIAVKLFWWSAGFQPGMESNLSVTIKELTGAAVTTVVSDPTNAGAASLGGWTMLTGIDFPQPGCWEITGKYLGQELTFVVETVRPDTPQRWQRVPPIADCLSDGRYRGPSEDIPVVLDEKFKAELMRQLDQILQDLHEPFCWYEISSGEVVLRAGSTCNCPIDFHFRNEASDWSVTRVDVRPCDVQCEERNNIKLDPT